MVETPTTPETHRATKAQNRLAPQLADREVNRAVAGRLHEAVRAAGGNQAVARRSGVPLATVNNYVRGRNGMKIEPLSALATACNVSLQWLVSGADGSANGARAYPDFPTADATSPLGLGETPAGSSPAGTNGGIDVRILAKAIEIVAAIAGAADFLDDPKEWARRIAATYAVLIEPETPRD
ncbi:MAG TPA: helix-turn-helix transcriptional regulator [Acetobacteraceae bacterium]|nr:helix-turn-helix transcriptional regulator [Acetobacteraceae bacterium]